MRNWIEKILESCDRSEISQGWGVLPPLDDTAYLLFRRKESVFELIEKRGFSSGEVHYDFLENTPLWRSGLENGYKIIEGDHCIFKERKLWVIVDNSVDPNYLMTVEVRHAEPEIGLFLRTVLIHYIAVLNEKYEVNDLELPIWLGKLLPQLKNCSSPSLIVAEKGSGREELARALLRQKFGSESEGIFFNPGRLSEAVQLREFFGDSAGKRLGGDGPGMAMINRPEKAIIIREAGTIAPQVQLRLLALFSSKDMGSKFWIFQTTRDLKAMVEADLFQEGLYSILNSNKTILPPVRENRGELDLEVQRLIKSFRKKYRRDIRLSASALQLILEYSWPGNWKELKGTLKRAFLMCRGRILEPHDLRPGSWMPAVELDDLNLRSQSEELEKSLLLRAYALHAGNQVQMAHALDISRGSLQYKMDKYKIHLLKSGKN